MAVISTVGKIKVQETYPIIKLSIMNNKLIVLFTKKDFGFVIAENDEFIVGYHSGTWIEENFQVFNEPITLQNKQ